ncbi:hypothetical protein CWI54_27590, partial [Escherichia coli]|uniref:hypothetical protein n=1 Tax=Escherichia coli TaxID=562 RepID=UPI000CB3945C
LVLETLLPTVTLPPRHLAYKVTPPPVTPSASFLATTKMVLNAGKSQGLQVEHGADMVLRHLAESGGKAVGELETLQFQLNMFS